MEQGSGAKSKNEGLKQGGVVMTFRGGIEEAEAWSWMFNSKFI